MKITDFSEVDITPEFSSGSEVVRIRSEIPNIRTGLSIEPSGNGPVGISIYNSDSLTNYGWANISINPQISDTLILSGRAVGTGTKPTILHSLLKLKSEIVPTENSDIVNKKYVDAETKTVGVAVEPTVTYNDPSANYITISGGVYYVNATIDYTNEMYEISPPDVSLNIATEGVSYFVYAEYTVGGGIVTMTTDFHDIHQSNRAVIGRVIRTGSIYHVTNYDHLANGLPEKLNAMTEHILGYNVAEGLGISVPGTRNVKCDEGTVWYGGTELDLLGIDTSVADTYVFVYWNGSAWIFSLQTQLNNTQYNDATGLQSLTGSNLAINWIYRGVEKQKHLYILLGTGNYKEDEALASGPPTPPSWITDHAILLGRVMFVKSSDTVAYNQSVHQLGYKFTGAVRHNDTTDRQGGTTSEYYHLNKIDYDLFTHTGNMVFPKQAGYGIKLDTAIPDWGWRDIIGEINTRGVGATEPAFNVFRGNIRGFEFSATLEKEVWITYHIPHDYVPGTAIHFHAHWAVNAATPDTAGTVRWGFEYSYAKGHNQEPFPTTTTVFVSQAPNATQYQHMIAETAAVTITGLEVDGLILCRVYRDADDAVNDTCADSAFLFTCDVHYQSTNMATKGKAPNFYL
jgi:hypothetical protein